MPNTRKKEQVAALQDKLKQVSSAVMVDYSGISVSDQEKIRQKLRDSSIDFFVVKNRLLRIAAAEAGINVLSEEIGGQTAVALGYEDVVVAPKVIAKLIGEFKKLKIKGGFLPEEYLTSENVITLSKIPGKQELYAQLVGVMAAPMRNILSAMQGSARDLVGVLNNYRQKQQEAA